MVPTFIPGDRVLTFSWGRFKTGDVIVFAQGSINYIKRIGKVSDNLYYVQGDNRQKSALMGPITRRRIVGKVIFKY